MLFNLYTAPALGMPLSPDASQAYREGIEQLVQIAARHSLTYAQVTAQQTAYFLALQQWKAYGGNACVLWLRSQESLDKNKLYVGGTEQFVPQKAIIVAEGNDDGAIKAIDINERPLVDAADGIVEQQGEHISVLEVPNAVTDRETPRQDKPLSLRRISFFSWFLFAPAGLLLGGTILLLFLRSKKLKKHR